MSTLKLPIIGKLVIHTLLAISALFLFSHGAIQGMNAQAAGISVSGGSSYGSKRRGISRKHGFKRRHGSRRSSRGSFRHRSFHNSGTVLRSGVSAGRVGDFQVRSKNRHHYKHSNRHNRRHAFNNNYYESGVRLGRGYNYGGGGYYDGHSGSRYYDGNHRGHRKFQRRHHSAFRRLRPDGIHVERRYRHSGSVIITIPTGNYYAGGGSASAVEEDCPQNHNCGYRLYTDGTGPKIILIEDDEIVGEANDPIDHNGPKVITLEEIN